MRLYGIYNITMRLLSLVKYFLRYNYMQNGVLNIFFCGIVACLLVMNCLTEDAFRYCYILQFAQVFNW